jgi:two-component system, cell cycle sensor histidine kinase and response regulator CckA
MSPPATPRPTQSKIERFQLAIQKKPTEFGQSRARLLGATVWCQHACFGNRRSRLVAGTLRLEREYSRLLFEEASDGMFLSDADGKYIAVNRSGHRLLGYDDGELIGRRIAEVVRRSDLKRLREELSAVARGEVSNQIWEMVRKDSSLVRAEVLAHLLSNGTILAVVRDLHARAEFDRALQASEDRLRSILETAADTILTVDRDGRVLSINRVAPPYTINQVIGSSCYDYVPADSRPRVKQAIEHVFNTRGFDEYIVGSTPGYPEQGWSAVRAGPLIEGGKVVAAILCATDVSERLRVSERNRELLERIRKIASMIPGMVYQFQRRPDGSACFPYASERISEIFRVSPDDVRENALPILQLIHPEDVEATTASLAQSANTLEAWHHEFRVKFDDGSVRCVFGSAVPERQPDGSTLWHGFVTDVTEQKNAARARAKLEEHLQQSQKMESVGQLAGGIAHDFNNMLTSIVAFVELLQDEIAPGAKARGYLEGIQTAANRGAELTQHLLAFARKKIVQLEEADLNAIVSRIAPMIARVVGEHIQVHLSLAPQLGRVKVDLGSMEQVIMNLIMNARDAMPEGGTLTLLTHDVELKDSDGLLHPDLAPGAYVVLEVIDTGTGMGPEVLAHLFEPFFTTKPQGIGTGLGLAMCHGILKQAGGTIAVQSQLGRGSSFAIYLPRYAPAKVVIQVTPRPSIVNTGHETVLIVDDEPLILRVARTSLEKLGYRVLCATDGLAALELARQHADELALVVTDVVMPKLGGRELVQRLQALRPGLKVLYTSGYAENEIAVQGVLREGVKLIQKPYALALLARRVREELDQN